MVKEVYINSSNDNAIILDGNPSTVVKEEILDICSRWKNMFLFGYPHHAKKRRMSAKAGIIYDEWLDSPRVCISYIPKQLENGNLSIKLLFSNTSPRKHSEKEIIYLISLFQQKVIEEIESLHD